MNTLKRLVAVGTLALVIALPAFAGETNTPPCSPGETSGPPPCQLMMLSTNLTAPGEILFPPATESVDIMSLAEIALGSLLIF